MSKINSIDFEKVEIYKLEKIFDIESFQCNNPIYEDYIKGEAYEDQANSIAQTWIFVYNNQNVIGYVSIAMGDLNKTQHEKLEQFPHTNVPFLISLWCGTVTLCVPSVRNMWFPVCPVCQNPDFVRIFKTSLHDNTGSLDGNFDYLAFFDLF